MATLRSIERARGFNHFRVPNVEDIDHGDLDNLMEDDHPQYFNDVRGDARYYQKTLLDAGQLDNRYYTESEADALFAAISHTHATSDITSGTFADARIAESNVTQHEAALTITESQISDLQSYLLDITGESLSDLSDTSISGSQATGSVLYWDGSDWADTDAIDIDPVGAVELKHNGGLVFQTGTDIEASGINGFLLKDVLSDDRVGFVLKNGATGASGGFTFVHWSDDVAYFDNRRTSGDMVFRGTDSDGATLNTMLRLDPDGSADLYYDGTKRVETTSTGLLISGASGVPIDVSVPSGTSSIRQTNADGGFAITTTVTTGDTFLEQMSSGGAKEENWLGLRRNGPVESYYNGTVEFRTADHNATDSLSGAEVKDYGGTWRQVGFLDAELVTHSSNHTVGKDDWGKTLRALSGITNFTIDSDSAVPNDVMLTVIARNTDVNLVEGLGVTIRWFDGVTGAGQTGDRTLANGGVCTVFKFSDTEYYIWGIGLS